VSKLLPPALPALPAWSASRDVPVAWRERWNHAIFLLGEDETGSNVPEPVVPPLVQSANFRFSDTNAIRQAFLDESTSTLYTRGRNPSVELLNKKMAALEGTAAALHFGSGVAAMAAAIMHAAKAGDHVLCVANPYPWTAWLLRDYLPRFGVKADFVDAQHTQAVMDACKPQTRALVLESPNSFTFAVQDIAALTAFARSRDICTILDNSYATPLRQQAASLGVDLIVHSATKYLNGHGDVVAGAVCGSQKRMTSLFKEELQGLGGILSPHDAWLMLRGLRTLPVRLERIGETACRLVEAFSQDHRITAIHFPWHPDHPQAELVRKQMWGPCGQFTVQLDTQDPACAERFTDALQWFQIAVSWGGYESLVLPAVAKPGNTLPVGTVRFCAGLEDPAILWADCQQALDAAFGGS